MTKYAYSRKYQIVMPYCAACGSVSPDYVCAKCRLTLRLAVTNGIVARTGEQMAQFSILAWGLYWQMVDEGYFLDPEPPA